LINSAKISKILTHTLGKCVHVVFFIGLIGLGVTGCRSTQPVSSTIIRKDSVIMREKLVPITVKETLVRAAFTQDQLDSLTQALQAMPRVSRHIYMTDPQLKTQLAFTLDSLGRLAITCKTLEQTFWEKLKEKDRIILEKDQQIIKERETFGQKLSNFIDNALWLAIISTIAYGVFNFWMFKKLRA
jgi:hypothetical protein